MAEQQIYRALVVDDEPMIREGVSRTMAKNSFCCDTAADGHEALQKYRETCHDLVVTDLRMPKQHGHALVLKLLAEANPPHIVVLTGVADHRLVKDLFSRGVRDVVHKPVGFHVFATKMLSIFEQQYWSDSLCRSNASVVASSQQPVVAKTEAAIELFSLCVPDALDQALSEGTHSLSEPPSTVIQFMERLLANRSDLPEQRRMARMSLLSTAVAMPVNKDFVSQGEAFKLTFCDLSEAGAFLMHTRSVGSEYLALRWRSAISPKCFLKAVMQITRCKPLGPFYEVAGQFVMHD